MSSDKPLPPNIVFAETDDFDDWPGLEKTINAAIDRAEELGI